MAKISACIISYNEEKKIEDCLKSLLPIADEIIIVDSLSSDDTLKIARKYTDKVFHQKFLGHIEQKNLAVEKASHDWVISLDCDERLTDELQQSILAIKNQLDETDSDAYCMARKTFYIYRWLNHCWYPDVKTRLFNKNTAHWGGTNPHDRIIPDGNNIVKLNGDIQHYSFDTLSAHLQTIDKFTEIGADELIKKNKKVSIFSPFSHGIWIFIKIYFLKRGFLDGFAGILVAMLSFMHVFLKYSKVIVKRKANENRNS
ncbi:MAG: glycosyltransferase family 2 protein [Gammaproteobacteria bacterium]|nr:glycosyltransferase family 2 protein [Gammaproteobacteria bacterium]